MQHLGMNTNRAHLNIVDRPLSRGKSEVPSLHSTTFTQKLHVSHAAYSLIGFSECLRLSVLRVDSVHTK